MPLNTTPPSHKIHKKNFNAQEHGVDLNAVLEDWSGVPAAQAEAAGIAAHEAAERRAARKRQAARTADQARREHRRGVQMHWAAAWPMEVRKTADLPLATMALGGLLVARSSAGGILKMSLTEMQGRLSTTMPTVTAATKRLEALGWITVERRKIGPARHAVNTYRLVHPLLIEAARADKGGGTKVGFSPLPTEDQKTINTTVQGAANAAGLHDEGTAVRPPRRSQRRAGRNDRRAVQRPPDERREAPSGTPGGSAVPLVQRAEALLTTGPFAAFNAAAYRAAVHRHGPLRAAQAVAAAAEMCRVREGSADPVRDPPAYLGGMLRRRCGELRPDLTLGRIEARLRDQ